MGETIGSSACPYVRAVAVLQEKWALLIVAALLEGPAGFNELSRKVSGVCPGTLSGRLSLLEEMNIIVKTVQCANPPRTSYTLSERGAELGPVVEAIRAWGQRFFQDDSSDHLLKELECH